MTQPQFNVNNSHPFKQYVHSIEKVNFLSY